MAYDDEVRGGLPLLLCGSQDEWDGWLERHGTQARGVWLVHAKKGSPVVSVTYTAAVETALCHGWIDGQKGAYDADVYLQRFTPRTSSSAWSQVNRGLALRLVEQGRMRPAGLAAVERAQASGAWERAYAPASTMTVPEDLQAALDASPAAAAAFAALDRTNRYAVLHRAQAPRTPPGRAKRIASLVEMLARGDTPHPRSGP